MDKQRNLLAELGNLLVQFQLERMKKEASAEALAKVSSTPASNAQVTESDPGKEEYITDERNRK